MYYAKCSLDISAFPLSPCLWPGGTVGTRSPCENDNNISDNKVCRSLFHQIWLSWIGCGEHGVGSDPMLVKARSLQCGFSARNSQVLFRILQWTFSSCFPQGEKGPEKSARKSPAKFTQSFVRINSPRISAEAFSWGSAAFLAVLSHHRECEMKSPHSEI